LDAGGCVLGFITDSKEGARAEVGEVGTAMTVDGGVVADVAVVARGGCWKWVDHGMAWLCLNLAVAKARGLTGRRDLGGRLREGGLGELIDQLCCSSL
jgi:hypothetical protein